MTTIITRLYSDTKTAQAVRTALIEAGNRAADVDVLAFEDTTDGAQARMEAALVPPASAAAYAARLGGTQVLLVARVPFAPIGLALKSIEIANGQPSVDAGVANENAYRDEAPLGPFLPKILKDHPLMLSSDMTPAANRRRRTLSPALGLPLLSRRTARVSAKGKAKPMSSRFWPMPLLSRRKPSGVLIEGGGTPFSTRLGWPLLVSRDWPFGSRS